MFTAREDILMTLFHCGICDLSLLDGIQYDAEEVMGQLEGFSIDDLSINMYTRAAFDLGFIEIREAVEKRVEELKSYASADGGLSEEEQEELDNILRLDPDEDFGSYHNCIDTHAYIEKNAEVYRRYFQDALDSFENNTGFPLESWD